MNTTTRPLGASVAAVLLASMGLTACADTERSIQYSTAWNFGPGACQFAPLTDLTVENGAGQIIGAQPDIRAQVKGERCVTSTQVTVSDEKIYTFVTAWRDHRGENRENETTISKAELEANDWQVG